MPDGDEYALGAPRQHDQVVCWRADRLVAAGFDPVTALQLAELPHVSLEDAKRLLDAGCPVATAARILA